MHNQTTKTVQEHKPRVIVYLDADMIKLIDETDTARSVYIREVLNDHFNSEPEPEPGVNLLSDEIRALAEKHYMDVAMTQLTQPKLNDSKPELEDENVIIIPESLRAGVCKYGYQDSRVFIDDAIKHYAASMERKSEPETPIYRF